ncbi:MAG: hypothetical protein AMXMBFR82_10300 [Candidatus Hydrogenedentota bacterium]
MKVTAQFWSITLIALALGCYSGGSVSVTGPEFGFGSFIDSIPSFPYDAPASRQERIVEAFPKLEIGMDKERVRELLGDPDAEFQEYAGKDEDAFLGSSWGFYLHRHDAELVDEEHDRTIFVEFDTSGKVDRARLDEPRSLLELNDPAYRYPKTGGNPMAIYIVIYLIAAFSCGFALIGAITRYRSDRHWSIRLQVIGASIVVLAIAWELLKPLLFTLMIPPLFDWRMPHVLAAIGLALFCIGYLVAARRVAGSTTATAKL